MMTIMMKMISLNVLNSRGPLRQDGTVRTLEFGNGILMNGTCDINLLLAVLASKESS